jgi:ABC-type polysaccharide/polyol phosphate export permease
MSPHRASQVRKVESPWRENRRTRSLFRLDLSDLGQSWDLIWLLAIRDLKLRYRQAFFGVAWALVQPLLAALVFTLLFSGIAHVHERGQSYLALALVGFMGWSYVTTTVTQAMDCLATNPALVTRVYFPRLAAPLAATIPGFVDFAVCVPLLALVVALSGASVGPSLLGLPLALALLVGTSFGAALFVAALSIRYKDVRFAFGFVIQLWFFASPVAYTLALVPRQWRLLYGLNPVSGALDALRWSLLGTAAHWSTIGISALAAVLLFVSGLAYFSATERTFADVI